MMNIIADTIPYQIETAFSPFLPSQLELALKTIKKSGFTGVEYAICYPDRVIPADIMQVTKKYGLKITSISTGQIFGRENSSLIHEDAERRKYAIEILKNHISLSYDIERPNVTIGLIRGLRGKIPLEKAKTMLMEALDPCINEAEKKGVLLQIEPICREEADFLNNVSETAELIHQLGDPPNVGILFDIYHSNVEKEDYKDVFQKYGNLIFNVHYSDTDRGLPKEDSSIHFQQITEELKMIGYYGALTLEAKSIPSKNYSIRHRGEAMRFATSF